MKCDCSKVKTKHTTGKSHNIQIFHFSVLHFPALPAYNSFYLARIRLKKTTTSILISSRNQSPWIPLMLSALDSQRSNDLSLCNTYSVCLHTWTLSHVLLFATPGSAARQAPLCMEFFRQEYWSRLPFPSPGDLSNTEIETTSQRNLSQVSILTF